MNDKPSVILKAFGAAGFVTCLYGLIIATWFQDQIWQIPVAFILCFTLVLSQPLEVALSARERVHDHRVKVARLVYEAATVGASPVAEGRGAVIAPTYSEAWTTYWLVWARYCRDKGAITYAATSEYYGGNAAASHATWTAILRPLQLEGLVMPIEKGQTTRLAPTVTLDELVGRFERGLGVSARYVPVFAPPLPFQALGEGTKEQVE